MQDKINRGFSYWLWWVLVLPISILLSVLSDIPVHFVLYRILSGFVTPYPELPELIIAPFFRGLVFVWASSLIAPEHNTRTALIFSGLWCLFSLVSLVMTFIGFETPLYKLTPSFQGVISISLGFVGAVQGFFLVKSQQKS